MSLAGLSHPRRRIATVLSTVALLLAGLGTSAIALSSPPTAQSDQGRVAYAVDEPLCATRAVPGHVNCFAMRRVRASKGTPGARAYAQPFSARSRSAGADAVGLGPAGGYTPDDLAAAYKYDPGVNRSKQTVGIVDWFDDPHIAADLGQFDSQYALPHETPSSFRKVNQNGAASPLPSASSGHGSAAEIALDVETVRGVCQTCRILLVEAKTSATANIAVAENTAVRLGANEVSNSFGGPESHESPTVRAAFNHPGVVLTASTGDDGWFGWDFANGANDMSQNAPVFPATAPTVVAVGGTALGLNNDGSIGEQPVWNENGVDDQSGLNNGAAEGAGGGGCSSEYAAPSWQSTFPGYSNAGCAGKRLAADVSAIADPQTGFDVYDTWGTHDNGWLTVGGTSLASPVVAAMYALAGGSGGAVYPAASLYENAANHPALVYDVVPTNDGLAAGNSFCGGDSTSNCGVSTFNLSSGATHNPNALGGGVVDCSFPRDNSDPVSAPPLSSECNAVVGYDGPTGVGTPFGGLFAATSPAVSLPRPSLARFLKATTFTARASERLNGAHVTKVTFHWGDGTSSSGSTLRRSHTYTKKGHHLVEVFVTDSAGQQSLAETPITVGEPLSVKVFGPKTVRLGQKGSFHVIASDPNTGGKVTSIRWSWGDGGSSTGARPNHAWHKSGSYRVRVTVTDNTGVRTVRVVTVKVA